MAIAVKHTTQATGTDAGNGEIRKAQWNEAHTLSMASGNLLGRSTSGAGVVEEISIGSGLSLNGGMLSASGGGGGGSSTLTIQNTTAAYTVVAGDIGTIINCTSGAFTVSLTAAATLGAGFNCWVWNTSATDTDSITIDPNASETIDGIATLILRRGEGLQIVCDGTNWQTGDKKTMRGFADNIHPTSTRPVATGNGAVAISIGAVASGPSSIAIGRSSVSFASYSFASSASAALSNYATALGMNSSASGSQAVTGSGAMALGGSYASGTDSFAAAVTNNTSTYGATGANSIAIGQQVKAQSANSIAIGALHTVSQTGAVALGYGNSVSRPYATAFGLYASSDTYGKLTLASGRFAATGDAQSGTFILRRATTDATATVLTADTGAALSTNQIILPNNSAYAFTGTIIARQQAAGGSDYAAWEIKGAIIRGATAASTSLGSYNINVLSKTAGASAWTVALSADTTNGGLAITVTGAAATNIRWVATVQTSEVTYA